MVAVGPRLNAEETSQGLRMGLSGGSCRSRDEVFFEFKHQSDVYDISPRGHGRFHCGSSISVEGRTVSCQPTMISFAWTPSLWLRVLPPLEA